LGLFAAVGPAGDLNQDLRFPGVIGNTFYGSKKAAFLLIIDDFEAVLLFLDQGLQLNRYFFTQAGFDFQDLKRLAMAAEFYDPFFRPFRRDFKLDEGRRPDFNPGFDHSLKIQMKRWLLRVITGDGSRFPDFTLVSFQINLQSNFTLPTRRDDPIEMGHGTASARTDFDNLQGIGTGIPEFKVMADHRPFLDLPEIVVRFLELKRGRPGYSESRPKKNYPENSRHLF
jgi:hypothetical protein